MKLSEYIEMLNDHAKRNPELLELPVYEYTPDGELARDFKLISICSADVQQDSKTYQLEDDFTSCDGFEVNAVILNISN